jgi:hypothetical protein
MKSTALFALVPVALTAACSGMNASGTADASPEGTSTSGAGQTEAAEPLQRKLFHGYKAVVYERSYRVCNAFSVTEVARQHGVRARRKAAARLTPAPSTKATTSGRLSSAAWTPSRGSRREPDPGWISS